MPRRSRRPRAQLAVKARPPAPRVAFTAGQVQALLQLQHGQSQAEPLPRPPAWSTDPFGPGRPLPPAPINLPRKPGGQAEPRLYEYPVATNIQIASRPFVPWPTLIAASGIPLFRKCIEARKSVCSLGFTITVDPKAVAREAALTGQAEKDIEAALRKQYTSEIARVSDWLEWPDRGNGYDWENWGRLVFENRLVFDATVIYPRKTLGGDVYSWEVPDGSRFKPLLDEHGRRPLPPFPAVQQILYGYPRGEYTADVDPADIDPVTGKPRVPGGFDADAVTYERTVIRPSSPYGMPATEIALWDGLVWMRRMGWILAEYTEGVTPAALLETGAEVDWNVRQWEEWLQALNDHLGGATEERHKFSLFPPGVHIVESSSVAEKYRPEYDMFLVKLVVGDFGLTATEVGFPEVGSLGASFHEGEEDVLNRRSRRPDANWLGRLATRLAVRQLRMPPVLTVKVLGLESEDEAAQDQVAQNRTQSARMTLNEDRARRGEPPYDFDEADMPMLLTPRGVVFLEGASKAAPPGTLVEPAHAELPPGSGEGGPPPQPAGQVKPARRQAVVAAKSAGAGTAVYEQLAEDYPAAAMGWVHHATWSGPVNVPASHIDMSGRKTWAADKETSRVEHFKEKIQAKGRTKPVVLVKTPGSAKLTVIDGHHRTLAYDELGLPVRAWIGAVSSDTGPWDEMHDQQYTAGEQQAAGKPATDTADTAAKAELDQFRAWCRKPARARPFTCQVITPGLAAGLAPGLLGDDRIVLKDADAGPKSLTPAGHGLAGTGMRS